MTHTPGPWTVGYKSMDVTGLTEKGPMKVCDIRGWGHLTGKGHGALGLPNDEAFAIQEANARLIAAAPAMLEALQRIADRRNTHFAGDAQVVALTTLRNAGLT
jgi:hypothetical protein